MKMRKSNFLQWGVISMTLVIGFFLAGCASLFTPGGPKADLGVYGSGVSEEELCTLEIAGGLKVVGFNEGVVAWGNNGSVRGENKNSGGKDYEAMMFGNNYKTIIKIPAGDHALTANLFLWDYNNFPGYNPKAGYVRANNLKINHSFLPGHTYFLRPVVTEKNGKATDVYKGNSFFGVLGSVTVSSIKLRIDEGETVVAEGSNTITFK
jgi:hypothetical protein